MHVASFLQVRRRCSLEISGTALSPSSPPGPFYKYNLCTILPFVRPCYGPRVTWASIRHIFKCFLFAWLFWAEKEREGGGGVKVKFFVSVDIYCYSLQRLVHFYTKQNKQVIIVLVCPDKNNCKIFPRKKIERRWPSITCLECIDKCKMIIRF